MKSRLTKKKHHFESNDVSSNWILFEMIPLLFKSRFIGCCVLLCVSVNFFGQRKQICTPSVRQPINFRLWHFCVYPTKLRIKSFHANQNHAIITRYSRQRWSIVQTVGMSREYWEEKRSKRKKCKSRLSCQSFVWSVWIAPKLAQWCVNSQTNFFF